MVHLYGPFEILPPRQNFVDDSYVKIRKNPLGPEVVTTLSPKGVQYSVPK